jgi:hypothetical protein
MPNHLQEKFQITVPGKEEQGEPWASFESAREPQGIPDWRSRKTTDIDGRKFNSMPPGMDISNQLYAEICPMPLSMAGESDVSADTNPTSFAEGFKKREMHGTDDQYTGEHVDQFYGDAGGFVERNNYLDRE